MILYHIYTVYISLYIYHCILIRHFTNYKFYFREVVGLLLAHDANPNIVDNKGSTAFHLASWTGNYDIVHMLLTQSSSVPNVNLKVTWSRH